MLGKGYPGTLNELLFWLGQSPPMVNALLLFRVWLPSLSPPLSSADTLLSIYIFLQFVSDKFLTATTWCHPTDGKEVVSTP